MNKTRRERLKSALYLRLRKRKTFFLGEKLEIFEFFSFAKCRIMPKNVKVGPFGFINIHSVAKFRKKTRRRTLWGHLKNLEKKSHSAKKIQKGDPSGTSGFVDLLEKVENERGDPLDQVCLGLRWFHDCF